MYSVTDNWEYIKKQIQIEYELTDVVYNTWIKEMQIFKEEFDLITILIPSNTSLALDYISKKFTNFFKVTITLLAERAVEIRFILEDEAKKERMKEKLIEDNDDLLDDPLDNSFGSMTNDENSDSDGDKKSSLNPKYTFDTFVVGNNNNLAYTAALAVADSPGEVYNPLFLYSKPGLGKTHLMHSIGHYIQENNKNMNVYYLTSEEFINEVVKSIRSGTSVSIQKMKDKFRKVDVLMVDDIQFIIGKERCQEEFFNTFNVLHSNGKQIVISSDKPPKDIETLEERFRSRFEWGLTVDIQSPDYETRKAILLKYMERIGRDVDEEITDYIASNITSSIRELEGAFNKILIYNKLNNNKQELTLDAVIDLLKDNISSDNARRINPQIILNTVCDYFNVSIEDLKSTKRHQHITYPRQIFMYLCRDMTEVPQVTVGRYINRDHSTVIHSVEKIDSYIAAKDQDVINDIESIKRKIALN